MEDFESLSEKLARLTDECERLRHENTRLRESLNQVAKPGPALSTDQPKQLSIQQKISLFRSLFRGREDVYATRWEKPDGRSGYSPASIRDWDALRSAAKSEWKMRDRETRQLLPLTDEAIHDHLSGKITVGVYPLLPNETCWFLVADFDQTTWREDAVAFLESCRELHVPAALERSRSGNGAHVWVFFAAPITAILRRKLGTALLTKTMQCRHQLGLRSYDRLFPNQDTMPHGGFGT